eukprot:COSAG06_NODE_63531_length_262_cov_0.625767_1_plen_43_part_10
MFNRRSAKGSDSLVKESAGYQLGQHSLAQIPFAAGVSPAGESP